MKDFFVVSKEDLWFPWILHLCGCITVFCWLLSPSVNWGRICLLLFSLPRSDLSLMPCCCLVGEFKLTQQVNKYLTFVVVFCLSVQVYLLSPSALRAPSLTYRSWGYVTWPVKSLYCWTHSGAFWSWKVSQEIITEKKCFTAGPWMKGYHDLLQM